MSEQNKHVWNKLKTPPPSALKTIHGGRLKGMTDINPQWRLEAMTEVFGACGVGWKYSIEKLWTEPGNGEEILAFALVWVQTCDGEKWSEPIPGIGGNKLVSVERSGPHNNDEAFKMAVTDALSVALKALGVASDIYSGLWDGSRYTQRPEDMVSQEQLNSLKLKYAKVHSEELEGLDRSDQLQRFNSWCREMIGEAVNYNSPESWHREWYETCWQKLLGTDSDVPFED